MWNEGYTSEINYTSGYYSELSPTRIQLALLACGIEHSVGENPDYLELGFGQGLSLNINAATSSGNFFGTDFNPGQVANARELARAMGKNIALLENSFEELAQRSDLPQFDIIALHGIWSWISDGSGPPSSNLRASRLSRAVPFISATMLLPDGRPAGHCESCCRNMQNESARGQSWTRWKLRFSSSKKSSVPMRPISSRIHRWRPAGRHQEA